MQDYPDWLRYRDVFFQMGTHPELLILLPDLIESGERVRLWYGDPAYGEPWDEDENVTGRIMTARDLFRRPALQATKHDRKGVLLDERSVLRIILTKRNDKGGPIELFRHPNYKFPHYRTDFDWQSSKWCVYRYLFDEGLRYQVRFFEDESTANQYMGFMKGLLFSKALALSSKVTCRTDRLRAQMHRKLIIFNQ